MKKNNKIEVPAPEPAPVIVIPKTNSQISEQLLHKIERQFTEQLQIGKISINKNKTYVQGPKVEETDPALKLQNMEQSLKLLKDSMEEQKRLERSQDRQKLMKAKEFVAKLKRQKQEHDNQLHQKEQSQRNILHKRIFSETIINTMKQRLQGKIIQKRQQIQERIKSIELRKQERRAQNIQQEMSYWQKLKDVNNKQSKSSVKLPSIYIKQREHTQINKGSRKNSLETVQSKQIISKPIESMSQKLHKYDLLINHKLQKIKVRKQQLKKINPEDLKDTLMANGIQMIQSNKMDNGEGLKKFKLYVNSDFIPYSVDKFKLFGNQYLKQSLLSIKKSNKAPSIHSEEHLEDKDLEVSTNIAHINKNQKIEKLREKWQRALSKIQHKEVLLEQGLQLINSIEKRLDKLDTQHIAIRLKKKCKTFEKLQNNKLPQIQDKSQQQVL